MAETSERPAAARAIYRGMDRPALDAAYNNGAAVADSPQWLARWREASAAVRFGPRARLDIPYGSRPRARVSTIFPPARQGRRCSYSFTAAIGSATTRIRSPSSPRGRAPTASTSRWWATRWRRMPASPISSEIHQALTVLSSRADDFGLDRNQLFVGGWSAGGHLTAMASGHPAFRGGIPISGIFDLEPIALTCLNEKLALNPTEIASLSPVRVLSVRSPPLKLFVGGNELPELQRQSALYADAAFAQGLPIGLTVLPGHHHYSILDELARPDGAIVRALLEMIQAGAASRK